MHPISALVKVLFPELSCPTTAISNSSFSSLGSILAASSRSLLSWTAMSGVTMRFPFSVRILSIPSVIFLSFSI